MIRPIQPSDNKALASIIRKNLEDHGLGIPGTVYTDPTTDHLFELFQNPDSVYFVLEEENKILGGCGIFPTKGLPEGHVELVKPYLSDEAKGKGFGRKLMEMSIAWAQSHGATHVYLETFGELSAAVSLYKKLGFFALEGPLGDSGHDACTIWMLKKLV